MNPERVGGTGASHTPLQIADQAIEQAKSLKAEVEAFVQSGSTTMIKVFGASVESVTVAESRGLGIRAIRDGRTGYAFTTDLSSAGVARAITEVRGALKAADADPYALLPCGGPDSYGESAPLWCAGVSEMSLASKTALALRAEEVALQDKRVGAVEESVYSDEEEHVAVCSTAGVRAESKQSYAFVYVVAHAGRSEERQSGLGFDAGRDPLLLDPERAGLEAARRAYGLVGARPCKTGRYTLVLDREVVAALLSTVAQALSADAVLKGRSVFAGRVGDSVASGHLTLLDDGLDPQGMATCPFDGEGVAQQKTLLIDGGVLRSYMYDSRTARREGGEACSTGNARRTSYRLLPRVGPSNLVVRAGEGTLESVIGRVGQGLYVDSVAGLHSGVNPVSGEISLGVTGNLIAKEALAAPVREVTMATDFNGLLGGVCDVGGDERWIPLYGSVCTPCVVVEGVTVSGV